MDNLHKLLPLLEQHPWLLLVAAGLFNEVVQRYPKIRANSLFQLLPNILMASPLGKVPGLKVVLDMLDTPKVEVPMPTPGTVLEGGKTEEKKP